MRQETIKEVLKFRDDRDWKQFHNPKDLAISISLEAAELLEVFQWSAEDVKCENKIDKVKEKLENIGYEVIAEGVTQFNIILDNKYLDMTLSETYAELESIKKDYKIDINLLKV